MTNEKRTKLKKAMNEMFTIMEKIINEEFASFEDLKQSLADARLGLSIYNSFGKVIHVETQVEDGIPAFVDLLQNTGDEYQFSTWISVEDLHFWCKSSDFHAIRQATLAALEEQAQC